MKHKKMCKLNLHFFYRLKRENISKHKATTAKHTPAPIYAITGFKYSAIVAPTNTTAPAKAILDIKQSIVNLALDDFE